MLRHIIIRLSIFFSLILLIILFCYLLIKDSLVAVVSTMVYIFFLMSFSSVYLLVESLYLKRKAKYKERNFNLIFSACLLIAVIFFVKKYMITF